jgi:hydrogenase maturation protease
LEARRNGRQNDQIEFIDGGTLGYLLIDRVADADLLIVLDAANLGAVAGAHRVVQGEDVYDFLSDRRNRSVHEVGLIDLVQMLDLGKTGPNELFLVGIQPENLDWGLDLSPSVSEKLTEIAGLVEARIDDWRRCAVAAPKGEASL